MRKWIGFLLAVGLSLMGLAAVVAQEESRPLNIAFIFDASGSMMAGMEGRTRLAVAQDAMAELTANLPADTNTSLWVYGHRLPQDDPAASCQDIEQVIPLGPADPAAFESAVRGIQAIGYTPITDTLQLAAQVLVDQPNARNTIVLVSDGEETCGGSPCLMAQALKQANIDLTVNTIGFAADDVTRQQLECIAEVTGGTYYDAPDSAQLTEALLSAVALPGTVRVVDGAATPLPDVAFQIVTAAGETVGDFVGTATVPAGDYRAIVPGEPIVDVAISVAQGETTDVVVDRPDLGTIRLVDEQGGAMVDQLFSAASAETGDGPSASGSVQVPPGQYTVTIYTTFPYEEQVTVNTDEVTDVVVRDQTGTLRMVDDGGNLLSDQLFSAVNADTLQSAAATGSLELPPGLYTVTIYTVFAYDVEVDVTADQTTDVVVSTAAGTLQLVDENGAPLDDQLFMATRLDSDESTAAQGSVELPPGLYSVEVFTVMPFTTQVEVTAGETTNVPVSTAEGTIQLVDENGAPIPSLLFMATSTADGSAVAAQGQIDVPPGEYVLEIFTVFETDVTVTVAPEQMTTVPIDTRAGTIQMVDGRGDVQASVLFTVAQVDGDGLTSAAGTVEVPPGLYEVDVLTDKPFTIEVEVLDGEITSINLSNASTDRPAP